MKIHLLFGFYWKAPRIYIQNEDSYYNKRGIQKLIKRDNFWLTKNEHESE